MMPSALGHSRWMPFVLRIFALLAVAGFIALFLNLEQPALALAGSKTLAKAQGSFSLQPFYDGCVEPNLTDERANATFVILAQDFDLKGLVASIKSVEMHFNKWYHYPYTILSDEDFSEKFRMMVTDAATGPVSFGRIAKKDWDFPPDVEDTWINDAAARQYDRAIMYGARVSYHKMCRFFSGKLHRHELVEKYEWYWRLEPDVEFFCDITYDVFLEMERHDKKYGFVVVARERQRTIPNLFRYTAAYKNMKKVPDTDLWKSLTTCGHAPRLASWDVDQDTHIPPMDGCIYPGLHFWTNIEIARVDLWNNPIYVDYFNYLDSKGGFWNERWGDAPVHTLGLALMLELKDLHYFRDIGYRHGAIGHHPGNAVGRQHSSKLGPTRYKVSPESQNGHGCRCSVPGTMKEWEAEDYSELLLDLFIRMQRNLSVIAED